MAIATQDNQYTSRLVSKEGVWWRRAFDVQAPYRWNVRRMDLGFTLDVGCGIGRNLAHLNGNGVGVDHNPASVEVARSRGLAAFLPDEFASTEFNRPGRFDSILLAHVLEHMPEGDAKGLVNAYVPLLKRGGKVLMITPQERGYASDPTHVNFVDFGVLRRLAKGAGLVCGEQFSFPFPRGVGRFFLYNEFVLLSTQP